MKLYLDNSHFIETENPIDISIPLTNTTDNPRAWYVDAPIIEPVIKNRFNGSVKDGGSVNFRNISFNPHGHGTHTECLGHITPIVHSVNQSLKSYFFNAELISVEPRMRQNEKDGCLDYIIEKDQLVEKLTGKKVRALIIRTLPNSETKKHLNYTETNPPYLDIDCIDVLNDCGVRHLLVDLPSVDRESDDGKLAFHHAFWQLPENPRFDKTITELVFIDESVNDGSYLLELQTAPFENDATPSRPVLYAICEEELENM